MEDFKIETINRLMVKFIGMEKDEAFNICKNENIRYRTTKQDGRSFIITCDYNTSRFNFEIENNIITKCDLG